MSGVLESSATAANSIATHEAPAPETENVQSAPPLGNQITALDIEDAVSQAAPGGAERPRVYITGWRLYVLTFGLCLSLLLSALETTIVSTSLVSITNALGGFGQRDWVVTSYLLTYTGFLVIYAKFSDIMGRKVMLLLGIALFTIFSIVCGSVSSMIELIIFRSLQGVGASGIYAMVSVINPEMVPPEKWGTYVGIVSVVFVLSAVLGPVLGGAINDHSSWRWVFLLNAPAGAAATAIIAFILPLHFPNHGNPDQPVGLREKFSRASLARLDILGASLLLAASVLVVFGFEEGGSRYPWDSPAVIAALAIGAVLFVAFIGWEHIIGAARFVQEPVFPLRLMKNRQFVGLILAAFFTGFPFMTVLINLPQRFQAVNGATPFEAGVHLLPLLLASPFATALAGQLATRLNIPAFYLLLTGASLQLVGVGLASSVAIGQDRYMYGYETILGFGFGMLLVTLLMFVPATVDRSDLAVAMGSITQVRVLGGTIGLAISSTILNNYLGPRLQTFLTPSEIQQLSDSIQFISTLPDATRAEVQQIFSVGYGAQLRVMLYFSVIVWLCVWLMWERKLKTAKDIRGY